MASTGRASAEMNEKMAHETTCDADGYDAKGYDLWGFDWGV
jgi:hypothetical protein